MDLKPKVTAVAAWWEFSAGRLFLWCFSGFWAGETPLRQYYIRQERALKFQLVPCRRWETTTLAVRKAKAVVEVYRENSDSKVLPQVQERTIWPGRLLFMSFLRTALTKWLVLVTVVAGVYNVMTTMFTSQLGLCGSGSVILKILWRHRVGTLGSYSLS